MNRLTLAPVKNFFGFTELAEAWALPEGYVLVGRHQSLWSVYDKAYSRRGAPNVLRAFAEARDREVQQN